MTDVLRVLPGELTADEILNGAYPFPPSPEFVIDDDAAGFAQERLTPVPPVGVHPRLLFGPDDLPDLRQRLQSTGSGQTMMATLRERTSETIGKPGNWEHDLVTKLAHGDLKGASAILNLGLPQSYPAGHYQPHLLYALVMDAFDALICDNTEKGRHVAAAITGYAALIEPWMDEVLKEPLSDDVWRVKIAGPVTGNWSDGQGLREIVGGHNLGYAYDFAFPFMSEAQREQVRRVISKATAGKIFMGASLPHHWRNWNWVMCAMGQPLLALAIEGEPGYDPRVYKLAVEIARDYLTYGISPQGSSTEAVGYTQFGFVWGVPFFVAAARRGDNLLTHCHHRAMIDWYLHTLEPYASVWRRSDNGDAEQWERNLPTLWTSHGDGGDEGPALWTMAMWKYFFPNDPKVDFLWRLVANGGRNEPFTGRFHIIEPLIWATDASIDERETIDLYQHGAALELPLTWFDPIRSSLTARSGWTADALAFQFECRTDSHTPSHEHADRGNFTLSALGRQWAKESFRSIETRHHNGILIDGLGQGFWPGAGRWIGYQERDWAVLACCDAKDAYDWWSPKTIAADAPETSPRFAYARWLSYGAEATNFQKTYGHHSMERDIRPAVIEHFKGFEQGDPRMWDEDGWPVRLPHNPVQCAFRTVATVLDGKPYSLIVDDIQKDDQERLYEWIMMTGFNTDLSKMVGNDVILCDATVPRDANGLPRPQSGDRQLLVRILQLNDPVKPEAYPSRPSIRLEVFEKKDTLGPNGRSFGLDRRLIVPSRSASPSYKILLFPHRAGEALPETIWNTEKTHLSVTWQQQTDNFTFVLGADGRTRVSLSRLGKLPLELL